MHRPRPSITDTPDRYIAVAVLVTETQRYLMKRRDDVPWIAFPDQWSFFGGGIVAGETPAQSLYHEFLEDLGSQPETNEYFIQIRLLLPFPDAVLEGISFYVLPF